MSLAPSRRIALITSTAALLAAALGARADDTGGTTLVFGLSQKLETVSNPGMTSPAGGSSSTATTRLSFAATSATPTDTANVSADLGLLITKNPDGSVDAKVDTPHLSLAYDQTTSTSELKFNLGYARDRLDAVLPLSAFIDSNGQLNLPTNPADLMGTGTRQTYDAGASLELGKGGPWGLTFATALNRTDYADIDPVVNPTLLNSSNASLSVTGRYSYSSVGAVTLGLSDTHKTVYSLPKDTKDTQSLDLGTSYALSPTFSLSGTASLARNDDTLSGRSTTTSAKIGGNYQMQDGALSFSLGTDASNLAWTQTTPTATMTASLSHGSDTTGNGTQDQLGLSFSQTVNATSGLNLGLFYSDTRTPGLDSTGTNLVVSYNQSLTQDWALNAGVNYRLHDTAATAPANSTGVFLSISRNFSIRK